MELNTLQKAAETYGTPTYLFDTDILTQEIQRLREHLGAEIALCYAMKANPFLTGPALPSVERIEVCSFGEFQICRALRVPPEKLVISGVLKKPDELREIFEYCGARSVYTVESRNQWTLLGALGAGHEETLRVYLRLGGDSQFGMDEGEAERLIREREETMCLRIEGLHYFTGTQKRSIEQIRAELSHLDWFCTHLEDAYQLRIRELEYGPGFGVPYFAGQECGTYEADGLRQAAAAVRAMKWKGRVIFEMGRIMAAMCGFYMTTVGDVKKNHGVRYCITDGGAHQLNYDGQIRGMYRPFFRQIPERTGAEQKEWTVCGALCTANDILCGRLPASEIRAGDVLVFERTGAYSVTEGMALFLSRELPAVILYSEKTGFVSARRRRCVYDWNMAKEEDDGYNGDIAEYTGGN